MDRPAVLAKLKKHAPSAGRHAWKIIKALATQTVTVTDTSAPATVIPHPSVCLDSLYGQRLDIEEQT
ncbi:hypothetical protein [Arcanobacterium phocae]|nr:hypothetical protein [Arcanobacterium phocae]